MRKGLLPRDGARLSTEIDRIWRQSPHRLADQRRKGFAVKKDQEARILGNQALLMQALATLLSQSAGYGNGHMSHELQRRAVDNETFIRDYLK